MTDNELALAIVAQLDAFMPADPVLSELAGLQAVQSFQNRPQGIESTPTVYFFKVSDKRYGFPHVKDTFVAPVAPDTVGTMRHEETQQYITRIQFMALVPQSPEVNVTTTSDVLNVVAGIIASDACRAAFRAQDLGILRVMDVTNPYFSDDRNRWEAAPSFDVLFTHKRVRTSVEPVLVTYNANVGRV